MTAVTYTSTEGLDLQGTEVGAWLAETTAGAATGAGASNDLSATGIDLDATGTLTKSAVNTGAGLMAFSGWSTSDYLSRAYGADLDITDQITLMGWVKPSAFGTHQSICGNLHAPTGDNGGCFLGIGTGGNLRFTTADAAGTLFDLYSATALTVNVWTFVCATLTTLGVLNLYQDGVLTDTQTGFTLPVATVEPFKVGVVYYSAISNPFVGGIAGVSVINGVLTAAQIKNIYDTEKTLFKKYAPYRAVGTEYSLDIILESAMPNREIDATPVRSIGGAQETIERNRDTFHSITIGSIARVPTTGETTARQVVEIFLESIQNGETFELDIYGSVATPDDPVNVIADQGYTFNMVSNNLFTTSIRVRETE